MYFLFLSLCTGGVQGAIGGANMATASSTTTSTAAKGSKEVIDISDDESDSHASGSQRFAYAANKYNINSMMHTSGGAVLQKKSVSSLPPSGAALWKGSVQLAQNQNKPPTTAIVTKTPIKDLNRGGISILTNSASSLQSKIALNTSLKGLSNVTCTPIKPKLVKSTPASQAISSKNVVTISKVLSGNKPDMIKLKTCTSGIGSSAQSNPTFVSSSPSPSSTTPSSGTFLRNIKGAEKINVPIRDQVLPADEPKTAVSRGNSTEGSAFNDLSNFVKSRLPNKPTDLMPNAMSSAVSQNFVRTEPSSTSAPLASPGSDQRMGRSDIFHQNMENCQSTAAMSNVNRVTSNAQSLSASSSIVDNRTNIEQPMRSLSELSTNGSGIVSTDAKVKDSNMKQILPNLYDAGLLVNSFMPQVPSANDFMTNYATSSSNMNPYLSKDMFAATSVAPPLKQMDGAGAVKDVGNDLMSNVDTPSLGSSMSGGAMTDTSISHSNSSNTNLSKQTSDGSEVSKSVDAHSTHHSFGMDGNKPYTSGYAGSGGGKEFESNSFYQQIPHTCSATSSLPSTYNSRPTDSNYFYNNHYHSSSSHWDPPTLPHPPNSYSGQPTMPSLPIPVNPHKLLPTSMDSPVYSHMPQATSMTMPTSHHDNTYPWISSASNKPRHNQPTANNNPYSFLSSPSQSSSDYLGYNYINQGLGQSSPYLPYYPTQMGLAADQFGPSMPMYHHSFARPPPPQQQQQQQQQGSAVSAVPGNATNMFEPTDSGVSPTTSSSQSSSSSAYNMAPS